MFLNNSWRGYPAGGYNRRYYGMTESESHDNGPNALIINIERAANTNDNYRLALWTGKHLQVTLMCLKPGEDIGLEIHHDTDQFLRIESGQGIAMLGDTRDNLDIRGHLYPNSAVCVPAGKWHNIVNTGKIPLRLYSIYAPPHHPHGTIEPQKPKE